MHRKFRSASFASGDLHCNQLLILLLFGWGLGTILIAQTWINTPENTLKFISTIISILFIISAIFWFFGIKGNHPAYFVMSLISPIIWLATNYLQPVYAPTLMKKIKNPIQLYRISYEFLLIQIYL